MIYFLIYTNRDGRIEYYEDIFRRCVKFLLLEIHHWNIKNFKIIFVDNNSPDSYGKLPLYDEYTVCYTSNKTHHMIDLLKDTKSPVAKDTLLKYLSMYNTSIIDTFSVIKSLNIQDTDFIVKLDGNVFIDTLSPFMENLKDVCYNTKAYDCIVRYGSYMRPMSSKHTTCITHLLGIRCKYIRRFEEFARSRSIDNLYDWCAITRMIPDDNISMLDTIGGYVHRGTYSNMYIHI